MPRQISDLPTDIKNIILGYYYTCIPKKLSNEIQNFSKLMAIKQKYYYSPDTKIWNLDKVIAKLQELPLYTPIKSAIILKKYNGFVVWSDKFKMINVLWNLYTTEEQDEIVTNRFYDIISS
jgi:hypothetical protein